MKFLVDKTPETALECPLIDGNNCSIDQGLKPCHLQFAGSCAHLQSFSDFIKTTEKQPCNPEEISCTIWDLKDGDMLCEDGSLQYFYYVVLGDHIIYSDGSIGDKEDITLTDIYYASRFCQTFGEFKSEIELYEQNKTTTKPRIKLIEDDF